MNMDIPQTTQFINNILFQISHCTTSTTPTGEDGLGNPTQRHPRLTQPSSAFPTFQLTNLKPLMLTLHCIFPNEFLLALDILDRGLVRRVRTQHITETRGGDKTQEGDERAIKIPIEDPNKNRAPEEDFFFVTSASTIPRPSRLSFPASEPGGDQRQMQKQTQWQEKGYEVRLQAWNCTCPSFTMSAFRSLGPDPSSSPLSSSKHTDDAEDDDDPAPDHSGNQNANADADASDADAYSFGGTLPLHPESAPPVCKHILACLLAALCPGLGAGSGKAGSDRFVTIDMEEVAALCAGWGG
ncbi:hypothetical protein BDW62DRAFT_195311 [Aspergillus aurantiobrunneus]